MLLDANLLLYAALDDFPQHPAARTWLEAQLNGPRRVGVPWFSLLAFVRITTNPRLFEKPLDTASAWQQVREWLDRPQIWIPTPTERHGELLERMLLATNATGNLVSDAHLASLAVEHGQTLYSTDRDFAAFPDLHWVNPLA